MIRHLLRAYRRNELVTVKRQLAQAFQIICRTKSTSKKLSSKVPQNVLDTMDAGFEALQKSNSESLLKKYLTPNLYKKLRTQRTPNSSLLDCIQSGLVNHDSGCGVYAADEDCYQVFAELFNPIIKEYHFGFKDKDKHPDKFFGNPCKFSDLDPLRHYISSTRIRCARSLHGYPFHPTMTRKQYDDIEDIVQCTLSNMGEEFRGHYFPLFGMKKIVQEKLINNHFLFKPGDRFLRAAKACEHWPIGRGIYFNYAKTFLVWCNEEDHLRIISMQRGGDFGEVYSRLIRALNTIEKKIEFSRHPRLGYLTFCPTNLGTTIRCSVHIRVPKLADNLDQLKKVALKYKLQVRGSHGEHTESDKGIYDISNRRRLGITEFEAVSEIYNGIKEIIKLEEAAKPASAMKKDSGPALAEGEKKRSLKDCVTPKPVLIDCCSGKPLSEMRKAREEAEKKAAASKPKPKPSKEPPKKAAKKPAKKPEKKADKPAAEKPPAEASSCKSTTASCKPIKKSDSKPACKPGAKAAAKKPAPKKKPDPKAAAKKCKKPEPKK